MTRRRNPAPDSSSLLAASPRAGAALLAVLVLLSAAVCDGWAAGTKRRRIRQHDDFALGRLDGLGLRDDGSLVLGLETHPAAEAGQRVWSVVPFPGGRFLLGTQEPAGVQLLDGKELRLLHGSQPGAGFLLTPALSDGAYAVAIDGGEVVAISADLRVSELASLPAEAVWSVATDRDGGLLAGTGPEGVLYRVAPDGAVEIRLDTPEFSLVSVMQASDGTLYAGSAENGNIYSLESGEEGGLWYHFEAGGEVRALAEGDGQIFAGINAPDEQLGLAPASGPVEGAAAEPAQDDHSSDGGAGASDESVQEPLEGPIEEDRLSGQLHAIDLEGRSEKLADFPGEFVLSMALESGGSVLVGTGPSGRLYRVEPASRRKTLLLKLDHSHVLALALREGSLAAVGTGDGGELLVIDGPSRRGNWVSPVYDAGSPARHGAIRLFGSGAVTVASRTGNSPDPDPGPFPSRSAAAPSDSSAGDPPSQATPGTTGGEATEPRSRAGPAASFRSGWSEWSREQPYPGGPCESPGGRFLQLRVTLERGGVEPIVDELTFFSASANRRPRVDSLTILPARGPVAPAGGKASLGEPTHGNSPADDRGTASPPPAEIAATPARAGPDPAQEGDLAAGERRIEWTSEDPDEDRLVYRLEYRGIDLGPEAPWLPVSGGEELVETSATWDTSAVPDGRYVIRVIASDSPANASDSSLEGARESKPFSIDNTRPRVEDLRFEQGQVRGRVVDRGSHVAAIHWCADGARWQAAGSADGVVDSTSEEFALPYEPEAGRPSVVAVKATDAHGNEGVGHLLVGATK